MAVGSGTSITALLASGTAALRAAGLEGARLDAEVLLAHVLGRERASLLAHGTEPVAEPARAVFTALIERRARGEPVAYLTGRRAWYDLALRVTPAVLVPRPETEGLLERALSWAAGRRVEAAVDVGTGSGALAIALARGLPAARIYAVDVSPAALAVARENAAVAGVSNAITFLQGDLLAPVPEALDLIMANLPYIGADEYRGLQPDVRLYEPRLALVGGPQGHELLARLLDAAPGRLRPGGALFAELGPLQAEASVAAAQQTFPSAEIRLENDYAGLARYLIVLT
jgi:release factor glutamine methyltransferase